MEPVSILPPSASELERDLELALARIEQVEIPIATLWNPWECPLEVLPFLAWALSVDVWRSDWPEVVKRRVVAGSLSVHRIKGTRPAVENALLDLGVKVDLVEWFEKMPEGEPGTFELTAWANENLTPSESTFLNDKLYEQVKLAVDNSKNTRSHYTFKVGARLDSGIAVGMAGTSFAATCRRDAMVEQSTLTGRSGVGVAGCIQAATVVYRKMEAK